ncbi:flavin reductase [Brachyspira murdochii]|uniref:Flavin reductase n=1 Tax=Brachyspira murdochii TaxID=84378 RepID=A0ABX5B9Z6_9SPIR|nr:flavin reductase [Brachyspira murdochii]PPS23167.1 flavin reductase [Brachyspira murdochii]
MNTFALTKLSYGMYILTTLDGDKPVGCTINTSTQITSTPTTIMISVNKNNYTNECIKKTGKFALSILSEKSDGVLIGGFGFRSSRDVNKFENVSYEMKEGLPIIKAANAYLICKVVNTLEVYTHTIFIGELIDADIFDNEANSMTYAYYHNVVKGKTPPNASTANAYKEEKKEEKKEEVKAVYRCKTCGFEYKGSVPFEDLPSDWVCPICGEPKSNFEKIS